MNARRLLIAVLTAICFIAACKKKDEATVITHPTIDSPTVVVTYPYTDTFSGDLSVSYSYNYEVDYDSVRSGYKFYVLHISADSIVFVSQDTISQDNWWGIPDRYFNDGYPVVDSNRYSFDGFNGGADPLSSSNSSNYFYLSDSSIQVIWQDSYQDEGRLSHPTGTVKWGITNGVYSGHLIRH